MLLEAKYGSRKKHKALRAVCRGSYRIFKLGQVGKSRHLEWYINQNLRIVVDHSKLLHMPKTPPKCSITVE